MQHRAQTAAHTAHHPHARRWIALAHGAPAGRLVEADGQGGVCIVDLAVAAERLRRGIGSALVRDAAARAWARGLDVHAQVAVDNAASLAIFLRLGFVAGPDRGTGRLDLALSAPTQGADAVQDGRTSSIGAGDG